MDDTKLTSGFPERPVTPDTIPAQIAAGGWKSVKCPLCDAAGASWWIDEMAACRYICPTCQRFTLTNPVIVFLKNENGNTTEVQRKRSEWSQDAAASELVKVITSAS